MKKLTPEVAARTIEAQTSLPSAVLQKLCLCCGL